MRKGKTKPRVRKVARDVLAGVLAAKGPSWAVQWLFVKLWAYRNDRDQIAGVYQADLLALIGWPTTADRAFRRAVAEGAGFGMWTNHAGVHGNASLLVLHPPHQWAEVRQSNAAKYPTRPGALAVAAAPSHDAPTAG